MCGSLYQHLGDKYPKFEARGVRAICWAENRKGTSKSQEEMGTQGR